MKTISLAAGLFFLGALTCSAVDPLPALDATPLPAGNLLARAPRFAEWRITFTYGKDKKPTGNAAATVPVAPDMAVIGLPRTVTITQTKPFWHGVLVDDAGNKTEAWYDGLMPYVIGQQNFPFVMYLNTPGIQMPPFLDFRGRNDFPDMDWVSPKTYLGTQKNTTYWVFQESDGPTVWIDSTTHYPVLWKKGDETRTIEFLPAPAEILVLPPDVAKLSAQQRFQHRIAEHTIPKGG